MSFEDDQEVDFDYVEGTFTMISNSGVSRTYQIDSESDLVRDILEAGKSGDIQIYVVEEQTQSGQNFSEFETDIRQEYREKYGEEFEDWKW